MTTKVIRIISHVAPQHMVEMIYGNEIRRDQLVEKMIYGNEIRNLLVDVTGPTHEDHVVKC